MAQSLNFLVTVFFDALLYPFRRLPPFWGILFLSILTALAVLLVYRYVSSPGKIKKAKNQIKANILAIRLYKDFWKIILASFFKSLGWTARYFALNFGPVLLLSPVLFLLFVQMDVRYGMRPFRPGEEIVLKARLQQRPEAVQPELLASPAFRPRMKPVFLTALREADWRLSAEREGTSELRLRIRGNEYGKSLLIGRQQAALSNKKLARSSWAHFIYPVEKMLAPAPGVLESLEIRYPPRYIPVLGLQTHWLFDYLLLVLVIVLALRKRFGVEF